MQSHPVPSSLVIAPFIGPIHTSSDPIKADPVPPINITVTADITIMQAHRVCGISVLGETNYAVRYPAPPSTPKSLIIFLFLSSLDNGT